MTKDPWPPAEDHPRIRGEHSALRERVTVYSGSSPHTRGARQSTRSQWWGSGIIPAYAGSTIGAAPRARDVPDHPRIRGEHLDRQESADRG